MRLLKNTTYIPDRDIIEIMKTSDTVYDLYHDIIYILAKKVEIYNRDFIEILSELNDNIIIEFIIAEKRDLVGYENSDFVFTDTQVKVKISMNKRLLYAEEKIYQIIRANSWIYYNIFEKRGSLKIIKDMPILSKESEEK